MIWIAAAIAIVLVLAAICASASTLPGLDEIEPQPCVSDDEFCKLLPEIPDDICRKVRGVLVDVSGWDRDEIHPNTRLIEFEVS